MSEIIYFIENKLGGVSSLNYNLINQVPKSMKQFIIHLDDVDGVMTKANLKYPVDKQIFFKITQKENCYSSIRNLRKLIPESTGAMILNNGREMAMLDHYSVMQTTYQLVHDEYNLGLAKKYNHIVDVFICHNKHIESELLNLFPNRKNEIFFLPHGVTISENYSEHIDDSAPLKLLFLGRFTKSKGIYDLPVISKILREKGIDVEWTCIGSGPELNLFKESWDSKDKVKYYSPNSNQEVMNLCAKNDVFVLPTKFEGSPVSLLEAMSAGLVPVITSLHGGIDEIVDNSIGFAIKKDDNTKFAEAIEKLNNDRVLLRQLSLNCRKKIIEEFDVTETSKRYFNLFNKFPEFKKNNFGKKIKIGSRLDHPLMPDSLTKLIRSVV